MRRGELRVYGPYNDTGCANSTDRYAKYYCDNDGGTPYFRCQLPPTAPLAGCCTAMSTYDDNIGTLGIYNIYGYCAVRKEDNDRQNGRSNLTVAELIRDEVFDQIAKSGRFVTKV